MFDTLGALFQAADGDKNRMIDLLLEDEIERSGEGEAQIAIRLVERWQLMRTGALQALSLSMRFQADSIAEHIPGLPPFISEGYSNENVLNTMMMALLYENPEDQDNSYFALPGAEAVLAATLVTAIEGTPVSSNQLFGALFIAKAVAHLAGKISQEQERPGKDCRYECALIAVPAAAALATLSGNSTRTIENAVALSMMRCEKFECLPVGEMVQLPCASRNAAQALNALISTDIALNGGVAGDAPDVIIQRLYAL